MTKQDHIDAFADKHAPCCAGCDFWRWLNSVVGECVRHAPNPAHDAAAGLGVQGFSAGGSSSMLVERGHWCGDFLDTPR